MNALRNLAGEDAALEAVERLLFNVLIGNGDAHLKNWALRYPDGCRASLTPAYDLVPTVYLIDDQDLGLKLAGSRDFADVRLRSFTTLATKVGLDAGQVEQRVVQVGRRILDAWPGLRDHVESEEYESLTSFRDGLPLVREIR